IRGRSYDPVAGDAGPPLASRCSRRVITSSYDNEYAADSGLVPGHSLFTGCLIKAIQGGLARHIRRPVAMGDELFVYLRGQVISQSSQRQTPRTGKLGFDEGGEFAVPLVTRTRKRPHGASSAPCLESRPQDPQAQDERHPPESRSSVEPEGR